MRKPIPAIDRAMRRVEIDENGCWNFMGARLPTGYGYVGVGSTKDGTARHEYTHRLTYQHFVGPIPDGHQVDHLCRNRSCCNPEHLEAVTIQVNQLRGFSVSGVNARKTHCPKGHELSGDNVVPRKGTGARGCRKCRREQWLAWRDRQRGAA